MTPGRTAPPAAREPARRPVPSWSAALPAFRHVIRTMPWATLLTGCLTGTAVLSLLRFVAHASDTSVDQNTMRLTVLPAIAALAFVPLTAFRPLVDTPLPSRPG